MNDIFLQRAEKWLSELGIKTIACPTCLMVSRDDIENLCGIGVIYQAFLDEMKTALDAKRLYWSHKDDNWLYLSSF